MPDQTQSALATTFDAPASAVADARILVTGGTGTFGQTFVRTLLEKFAPSRVVVFSRDEMKQSAMERALPISEYPPVRYFIGDVRDVERLEIAMRGIDYVIHGAALKQVPIAEYNPFECIHTNVFGAENVVRAALRCRIKKVIALSTDKAANPVSLYGASKLASDKIFIAANAMSADLGTRFSVVRYGNVAGSRGSVIPLFRELIGDGADHLPITDPEMTRFLITPAESVAFVLSALAMMRGGEVFIPKIPSIRITELARTMAPDLPQRVVGRRPGEKLHEVLIPVDSARNTVELEDRYVIEPQFPFWPRNSYDDLGARPVEKDFAYTSDTNSAWLDADQLAPLLKSL